MELQPEYIKIAKEVVQSIKDPKKHKIFSYVAGICQEMGGKVISEGIETEELFEIAFPHSDAFQGYYFGHPQEYCDQAFVTRI